jgi:hypothetical protein
MNEPKSYCAIFNLVNGSTSILPYQCHPSLIAYFRLKSDLYEMDTYSSCDLRTNSTSCMFKINPETSQTTHLIHGYNYKGRLSHKQTNEIKKQMLEVRCLSNYMSACEKRSILGTA